MVRNMFRYELPKAPAHQRIGILGGSFDPPHQGHLHISRLALRAFGLDQVWWMVSPANPLKKNAPADLKRRLMAAKDLANDPRIKVTGLEALLNTRFTADSLAAITTLYPKQSFIWLMGSDNLCQFHRWQRWQEIAHTMPIGVIARPTARARALFCPAARAMKTHRVLNLRALPDGAAPAWGMSQGALSHESSTRLRGQGLW